MDLNTLKAEHPTLFAEVREAGFNAGIAQERDRCTAHVKAGAKMGAGIVAAGFIVDGTEFSSQSAMAEYLTAGQNQNEASNRASDDGEAGNVSNAESKGAGDKPGAVDEREYTTSIFDHVSDDLGVDRVEA